VARELIILLRFKGDSRNARKLVEFDAETLEYVFDALISGDSRPSALQEHRLRKRGNHWSGFTECRLESDLLLIYRVRRRGRPASHWDRFSRCRDAAIIRPPLRPRRGK